jgi:hypothetical protein
MEMCKGISDKVYSVKIPNLSNCIATQYIPNDIRDNGFTWIVDKEYQFSIPGSISGTVNYYGLSIEGANRLDFQGSTDTTIDIQVLPTSTELGIIMIDPAGREMFHSNNVYPEEATKLTNINLRLMLRTSASDESRDESR